MTLLLAYQTSQLTYQGYKFHAVIGLLVLALVNNRITCRTPEKNRNPNDPAIRERDRPNPFEELTTAKEEIELK